MQLAGLNLSISQIISKINIPSILTFIRFKQLPFISFLLIQIHIFALKTHMLKQEFRQLKKTAVSELMQTAADVEQVLLQVYNIVYHKNDQMACFLSDGNHCIKAFLKNKQILQPEKNQFALIRVKQHVVGPNNKSVGIVNMELVCDYNQLIGNPKPFSSEQSPNPQDAITYSIDIKNITHKHLNMIQDNPKPLIESAPKNVMRTIKKEEIKTEEKREMRQPSAVKPLTGSVKDYETIKDLFVGFRGWHLLCRITKLDYQQFQKKNSDKLVKLLHIDLIDRSDVRISGTFFYEAAEKWKDELKLNSVYKISEGSIASENYNNSKNDKMSAFRLVFGVNSIFEQVSDVNIISRPQDAAITLADLLSKPIFDQEFDIIAILVEIQQPKDINKGDKVLTRWNWKIADPIKGKTIHAILWNDKMKPDFSLIGKTIILSRFALNDYKGSLTLKSKARSSIQVASQHPYQLEEQRTMNEYRSYQMLSQVRAMQEQQNNTGVIYRNLKDLNEAVQYINIGQTLKSDLDIYVTRILMNKWFYEGCPACNKAAEKGVSCHCGKYVQYTVPHFIMSVQLSDPYGSIYTTAYDQQAKRIFWEEAGVIHKLMKFEQNQLKEVVEDYLYQEFKLRLYTKKTEQGRIKHIMGKFQHKNHQHTAQQNVNLIYQMI